MTSRTGIQVMSTNLLLPNETDPVIWRGPVISGVGAAVLDRCAVELRLPVRGHASGDRRRVPQRVQSIPLDGIVIVASPQELVGMVVEKAVKMAEMMEVPIVGLVENMSYVACPDCGKRIYLFGQGKTAEAAERHHLPVLAEMPIDPGPGRPHRTPGISSPSRAPGWRPLPTSWRANNDNAALCLPQCGVFPSFLSVLCKFDRRKNADLWAKTVANSDRIRDNRN